MKLNQLQNREIMELKLEKADKDSTIVIMNKTGKIKEVQVQLGKEKHRLHCMYTIYISVVSTIPLLVERSEGWDPRVETLTSCNRYREFRYLIPNGLLIISPCTPLLGKQKVSSSISSYSFAGEIEFSIIFVPFQYFSSLPISIVSVTSHCDIDQGGKLFVTVVM